MRVADAVLSLCPGAEFVVRDNDPEQIEWISGPKRKPSVAKIKAEMERLAPIIEMQQRRRLEYPPIGDQLDDLFRAGAFSKEMADQIHAVKDKYPKE